MNGPAQYLHIGFLLISLANLIVIALLIVLFILAVTLRRPEKQRLSMIETTPDTSGTESGSTADAEVRP
ncbi:MAG: hypothetical protein NVS4B7_14100 [Ktedonobacteraceae bacterium]